MDWLERLRLRALSLGDPETLYEAVWNDYSKRIYYFVRRNFGFSKAETEDALQEIFLKIFRSLQDYDFDYSFNTWVYAIARNHCINLRRNDRNRDWSTLEEESLTGGQTPMDIALERERDADLERALANLDEGSRQIVYLRYYEGMKIGEIARTMEMPEGTVKYELHRCKEVLKKKLEAINEYR